MDYISILPTTFISKMEYSPSKKTLVLPYLITEGNEYHKQCLEFKKQGGEIWLDDGYYELRQNMKIEELVKKALSVNADVLVPFDLPHRSNIRFITESVIKQIRKLGYKGKIACLTSAENENINQDLEQFKIFNSMDEVDIIAIPYNFDKSSENKRAELLKLIEKEVGKGEIKKHIHLFGLSSYKNLLKEKDFKWISSIDSTWPFKLGMFKIQLPPKNKNMIEPSRPKSYFETNKLLPEQVKCIKNNIKYLKGLLK